MGANYHSLELHPLSRLVGYFRPEQELPSRLGPDSPAVLAMTDFRQVTAITVEPSVSIDWALQRMKDRGVRLLLVVNSLEQVQGLITACEIQGEKPMRVMQQHGRRREEIMVRDIMTAVGDLQVVMMEDVLKAKVGDIVATLQRLRRHHVLVLDNDPRRKTRCFRGIFSISQIGRQLDQSVQEIFETPNTFAEVNAVLRV